MPFDLGKIPTARPTLVGSKASGFTLTEVIIALGVFTVVMVASVGLLSSSVQGLHAVDNRDNAIRLTAALEDALRSKNLTEVYGWVQDNKPLFAYSYRASSTVFMPDGTPQPQVQYQDLDEIQIVSNLRAEGDSRLALETAALHGQLYRVVLTLSEANPVKPLPATVETYTEPVLAVKAQFYLSPGITSVAQTGALPVHSCTISYTVQ